MEIPLELVIEGREVALYGLGPHASVAELAAAAALADAPSLWVDGRAVPREGSLIEADVRRGSSISSVGPDPSPAVGELTWRAGPSAGVTTALAVGVHLVGRATGRPWIVTVDGDSAGPVSRPAADRPQRTAAPFATRPLDAARAAEPGAVTGPGQTPWTRVLNRPPRPGGTAPPAPLRPPAAPAASSPSGSGVGLLPAAISLVGAGAAALLFRQPLWLLLAGLGALGTLAGRWQQRWRERRLARRERERLAAAHQAFAATVAAAHAAAWAASASLPDVAEAVRRAESGSAHLWERRPSHGDAYTVALGLGELPWEPVLDGPADAVAAAVVRAHAALRDVPVPVALGAGAVLGVVGPRPVARAVARSAVLQLAVQHGPADVCVVGLALERGAAWSWLRWLPHAKAVDDGRPLLATGEVAADRLLADLASGAQDARSPLLLLVVDDARLAGARTSGTRAALAGRSGAAAGIVLANRAEELPSSCTHVLTVDAAWTGTLRSVQDGATVEGIRLAGADRATADSVARRLAGFDDPESTSQAALPATVGLAELLGPAAHDAQLLTGVWAALGADPPVRAPLGLAADGVVELDLERDGPHALVAGTTGAGKSELLRSWIAGLAVRCRPTDVTFVLVDYKGGAAFDACAGLPHVVGVVTDLDEALAARALCSLEAEVRRRERVLRVAGASDLTAYRIGRPPGSASEVLPRLVVVVDEFAALAAELPTFLTALVDVARRGRSLGVHLVLATQRPGGAVSDDVRANTNLRIALRVQDAHDSHDVVGDGAAARLPRLRPGRAVVRLGPGELVTVQTARCTGTGQQRAVTAVMVREQWPVDLAAAVEPAATIARPAAPVAPSELDAIVAATCEAARRLGLPAPRRPWLPPLPDSLPLHRRPGAPVGLIDDPAEQRQLDLTWEPGSGNLLVVGSAAAGVGAALAALVLHATAAVAVRRRHAYVVDGAGSPWAGSLAGLAHVGAIVAADDTERLERLVRTLHRELVDRRGRRDGAATGPDIVLAVDGLVAVRAALDDPRRPELLEAFEAVVADGPAVGVHTVATVDRPAAMPSRLVAAFPLRWVLRLADGGDAAHVGGQAPPAGAPRGRAVLLPGGLSAQLALPDDPEDVRRLVVDLAVDLAADRAAGAHGGRCDGDGDGDGGGECPAPVGVLPLHVTTGSLPAAARRGPAWAVAIGMRDVDLGPAVLTVHPGDHLLVAGPARSGRTTALRLFAAAHRALHPHGAPAVLVTPRRADGPPAGPWTVLEPTDLERLVQLVPESTPGLVLVDDAEHVDDDDGVLTAIAARHHTCLIAAGRTEALRTLYGHWTHQVRRSRTGLLLRPLADADGDVLGVTLPRRAPSAPWPPGRGYLVADGVAELVQVAIVVPSAPPPVSARGPSATDRPTGTTGGVAARSPDRGAMLAGPPRRAGSRAPTARAP